MPFQVSTLPVILPIEFNRPCNIGTETHFINQAIKSGKLAGDGPFSQRCEQWLQAKVGATACMLTPSCSAALEMCALLLDIRPGDEVIMPSFTFVSTANAFVLRGAKICFVDIRPDTLNIDERLIADAINERTKAIVVVHYAGVACNMSAIVDIAHRHGIFLVEDAALAIDSYYENGHLGRFGHLATFSFHESKNITSGGEGGALVVNDPSLLPRAEVLREKGTNRNAFFRGEVDKYTWVDVGSSYLPSELQAAYLYAQLQALDEVTKRRLALWRHYREALQPLVEKDVIELPMPPGNCQHNAHICYFLVDAAIRDSLLQLLKAQAIHCTFHYVPLHSSIPGRSFGDFHGSDTFTTACSERIIRLPLWYGMSEAMANRVADELIRLLLK